MLAEHYAQALIELGEKAHSERLILVLKKKGHLALLPSIVREYGKLSERQGRQEEGELVVARKEDIDELKTYIKEYAAHLETGFPSGRIVENPALIGGFVLRKGEHEVDASYRTRLLNLYNALMKVSVAAK